MSGIRPGAWTDENLAVVLRNYASTPLLDPDVQAVLRASADRLVNIFDNSRDHEASHVLYEAHVENLIERVHVIEKHLWPEQFEVHDDD